ncbi:MAG: bifunctional UDP-sugar hydrolase/5'-nucleotidase [Bacilli bacterium]
MKQKYINVLLIPMMALSLFSCQNTKSNGDVVILYTNDVHCAVDDNLGYATLSAYLKDTKATNPNTTLVDVGDFIQGNIMGSISKGSYIIDLMNAVGYDYVTYGNHEFAYGMDQLVTLTDELNAQALSRNFTYTGEGESPFSDEVLPYSIKDYGSCKVGFVGITTPFTISNSIPTNFMDNDGNFIYSFKGETKETFYSVIQDNIDACRKADADYVILMGHLGNNDASSPFSSVDVIKNTTGADVFLDAHAHSTINSEYYENLDGKNVILSSTGTELNAIGRLNISQSGTISTSLITKYPKKDQVIVDKISGIKQEYEEKINTVIGTSDVNLTRYNENGVRIVRNCETNIGDFTADAYRSISHADIGFCNGGGIRADIAQGDITYGDAIAVNPFGNQLSEVKASGMEIADALEFSYRLTQEEASNGTSVGENGGFFQVSGLKCDIDVSVPSSVTLDENNMFSGITGERREKIFRFFRMIRLMLPLIQTKPILSPPLTIL